MEFLYIKVLIWQNYIMSYQRGIMKKIFLLFIAATFLHSASFVSPIGFGGTQHEKDQVLSYIKEDTKKRYTEIP